MIKIGFNRRGDRVSLVVAGVLLAVFFAAPAVAQESRPLNNIGALKLTAPVLWAAAGTPAPAPGGAAQAPVAEVASFFRGVEFTGFVDFYYLYNFNTPTANNTLFRAFDTAHNAFTLQLAELALEKKPVSDSRAGYRLDFQYGPTATAVNQTADPLSGGNFRNIEQAYLSYLAPIGSGLQLDFGKWVTQHGAEVIETRDNWNYSRSLLFTWPIPFHHTGVRALYTINDKVSVAGSLSNGWNNTTDNNTGKTVGAGITIKPVSDVTVVGNYMGGPEQAGNNSNWRNLIDATLTFPLTPQVTIMGNYDYARESCATAGSAPCTGTATRVTAQGVAAYLKYQANDMFALVPRFEYFSDSDGATTGTAQKLKEGTLTIEMKHMSGVRFLIEYRRDWSNINTWVQDATNTPVDHQDTLTFGLVYAFGMN